jgi:general secretion pathway protein D
MEPRVNGPNDITLHVKVEISEVTQTENIGGVDQPVIGQTVNEANIRVKDGEVSVLGGLSDRSDSTTISGIPGVVNMPVLGYLFGSKAKQRNDQEILIAIIPHIIRAPDLSAVGDTPIETGTESNVRVLRSIPSSVSITLPSAPAASPAPAQTQPHSPAPVPAAPARHPPAIPQRSTTSGSNPAASTPAAGAGPPNSQKP